MFSNIIAELSSKYDVEPILSKYKKMYIMSYKFVLMFSATITEHSLFLKLMYRAINQQSDKYKLLRFPLDCHLEKELSPILFDLYQRNTDLEVADCKPTQLGILKGASSSIKKTVTFDLPPIKEEEKRDYRESPLIKYLHLKLHSNLIDPRHLDK